VPEIQGSVWRLATQAQGSIVVQHFLEHASDDAARVAVAEELRGHVWEAMRCPHANYVLQKCVTTLRPQALHFIFQEIFASGPRAAARAARQCYGCRVLQRILEHCPPTQLQMLVDDLLTEAVGLSRHQFGNYVMQRLAEHGTETQQRTLMTLLAESAELVGFSVHGCAVLTRVLALNRSPEQLALAAALLHVEGLVQRMGRTRHGHVVVELMLQVLAEEQELRAILQRQLIASVAGLASSRYGRALAARVAHADPH
jgi:mRNA-binding protein PUF3